MKYPSKHKLRLQYAEVETQKNWDALILNFLANLEVSSFSKFQYSKRLEQFKSFLLNEQIFSPERKDLLKFKSVLKEKNLQSNTIGAYFVPIRLLFEWTEINRIYPNIAAGIKGAKRPKGFRRDSLTISQVHQLMDSISRSEVKGKRDFALINLLIRTGLRTVEVIRCKIGSIRPVSSDTIGLWVQGKGHEEADEFVILTEECVGPIMDYIATRGSLNQESPLFASLSDGSYGNSLSTRTIRRVVKERLRSAGLSNPMYSSHGLRHTSVTLSLAGGASIQEAQKMARHADISTTTIYAHNIDRAKGVAERSIENILKR